jgi:hypothetical protein
MLLKHLFIAFHNQALNRIPFFIELRDIPSEATLISYMTDQLRAIAPQFDESLFEYALSKGKFIFLLDAFDEIGPSRRDEVANQILKLSYRYSENLILLSSRPDNILVRGTNFSLPRCRGLHRSKFYH